MPDDLDRKLTNHTTAILLGGILFVVAVEFWHFIQFERPFFLEAQEEQSVAMAEMKQSLSAQAEIIDGLAGTMASSMASDGAARLEAQLGDLQLAASIALERSNQCWSAVDRLSGDVAGLVQDTANIAGGIVPVVKRKD